MLLLANASMHDLLTSIFLYICIIVLSNAIKFTEEGQIIISVKLYTKEEDATLQSTISDQPSVKAAGTSSGISSIPFPNEPTHLLHVSVSDTGIGIPSSRFFRLFKLFSQIDSSTTRIHGGTGLGLSIAERLSALMGESMWVESPGVNQGSTFHFTIQTSPVPPQDKMDSDALDKLRQSSFHCLILDTNEIAREVVRKLIEAQGIQVHVASNFQEATALLDQFNVRVLLIDTKGGTDKAANTKVQIEQLEGVKALTSIRGWERAKKRATAEAILMTPIGVRLTTKAMDEHHIGTVCNKTVKLCRLLSALVDAFSAMAAGPK